MTKRTKLFVGAACVASLFSTSAFAAEPCDLSYIKAVTGQDFGFTESMEASKVAATLWELANYAPERAACSKQQAKSAFYQLNGKGVITPGQTIKLPRLAKLAPNAAPAATARSFTPAESTPAPTATPAPTPASIKGGILVDERIDRIEARIAAGGNLADMDALKAEMAALRAAQATQGTTTVVERQPVYTTKTVQAGLSKADQKKLNELENAVAAGKNLDASQLKELKELRDKQAAMRIDVDNLTGTASDHETRLTKAEQLLEQLKAQGGNFPWWGWALIALSILLGLLNLFRKAEKGEVRRVDGNVTKVSQRQHEIVLNPENLEEVLEGMETDQSLRVTLASPGNGEGFLDCTKSRWGKVFVEGNSMAMPIRAVRAYLIKRYLDGSVNGVA